MTSYERFLEYCAANPECPYGSDEKWAAKLGWDAQERHFQSRLATLEAVADAGIELNYLYQCVLGYEFDFLCCEYLEVDESQLTDGAKKLRGELDRIKELVAILTAYRQAKEVKG